MDATLYIDHATAAEIKSVPASPLPVVISLAGRHHLPSERAASVSSRPNPYQHRVSIKHHEAIAASHAPHLSPQIKYTGTAKSLGSSRSKLGAASSSKCVSLVAAGDHGVRQFKGTIVHEPKPAAPTSSAGQNSPTQKQQVKPCAATQGQGIGFWVLGFGV